MLLNKCVVFPVQFLVVIYQQIWIIVIIAHIIPCHIHTIPFAIVHLDVVPCMVSIIRLGMTKGIHAGDAQFIAEDMERPGITLAGRAKIIAAAH